METLILLAQEQVNGSNGPNTTTILAFAGTVLTLLTGAIGVLWRQQVAKQAAIEKRLAKREDQLDTEVKERLVISERVGKLEGLIEGYDFGELSGKKEQLKVAQEKFEDTHQAVIEKINEIGQNNE